jgi:hypothetical protein
MFPRKVDYVLAYIEKGTCYVLVRNNNYRPINLRMRIESGDVWRVEHRVPSRCKSTIDIGHVVRNYILIKDTLGNEIMMRLSHNDLNVNVISGSGQ